MVNPEKYCGGAKELELFITRLRSNFRIHTHTFPDEFIKVAYAIDHPGVWAAHRDP
jgi:hypothetical protein